MGSVRRGCKKGEVELSTGPPGLGEGARGGSGGGGRKTSNRAEG